MEPPVIRAALEALCEALPDMERGDIVTVHETDPECPAWDGDPCTCTPVVVTGPSGKA